MSLTSRSLSVSTSLTVVLFVDESEPLGAFPLVTIQTPALHVEFYFCRGSQQHDEIFLSWSFVLLPDALAGHPIHAVQGLHGAATGFSRTSHGVRQTRLFSKSLFLEDLMFRSHTQRNLTQTSIGMPD